MKLKHYYLIIVQLLPILIFFVRSEAFAQTSISFHVLNLKAGPAECNWMFETDDAPRCVTDDGNPYTMGGNINYNNFAYRTFTWTAEVGRASSGTCTAENTNQLNGVGGITLKLYDFSLNAFRHINTVNANNAWNIVAQAGDEREYVGGIGEIWDGVNLVFRATDCKLTVTTPYPTAAQMNAILGGNFFTNDVGTGFAVTASGRGTIDVGATLPAWKNEFDPNNTGQLDFDISTISSVIQNTYGYYDFDIQVKPTAIVHNMGFGNVPLMKTSKVGSATVDFPLSDVNFLINSATSGYGVMRTVFANQVITDPGGSAPDGIERICSQEYWQLGTTLENYSMDVTFDISDLTGITDASKLRILKRTNSTASWAVYEDFTLVDANHIRANGLTSFSEFAIGSNGSNPLSVELVSFNGSLNNKTVNLNWKTATEINNYGFEIERLAVSDKSLAKSSQFNAYSWQKVGFVQGSGNSNSPKEYAFNDDLSKTLLTTHNLTNIKYRLKQIDNNGSYTYSDKVEIAANFIPASLELNQNYPNPFNPDTEIEYQVAANSLITLRVYDLLGQQITELVNKYHNAGIYKVKFNASNLPSGTYFYRLSSPEQTITKKMLLTK